MMSINAAILFVPCLLAVFLVKPIESDVVGNWGCPENPYACLMYCQAHSFITGICDGELCVCKHDGEIPDISDEPNCPQDSRLCREFCFSLGLQWGTGYCDGLQCTCPHEHPLPLAEDVYNFCPGSAVRCNSFCTSFGSGYGYCQDNVCMCFPRTTEERFKLKSSPFGCPVEEDPCREKCLVIGFDGGYCALDSCTCFNRPCCKPLRLSNYAFCPGPIHCDDMCKKAGYGSGECQNTACVCHDRSEFQDDCGDAFCAMRCKAKNMTSGICMDDKNCACYSISGKSEKVLLRLLPKRYGCPENDHVCTATCVSLNFRDGYCDDSDRCTCLKTPDEKTWEHFSYHSGCPHRKHECIAHCRMIGYDNGDCDSNKCICNRIENFNAVFKDDCDDEYSCEGHCILAGYLSGTCMENRECHCTYLKNEMYDYMNEQLNQ